MFGKNLGLGVKNELDLSLGSFIYDLHDLKTFFFFFLLFEPQFPHMLKENNKIPDLHCSSSPNCEG